MKTIWLNHDYKKAAAKLQREFADRSHADRIFDRDTEVRVPDGETIAVLLCDVIPQKLHKRAYKLFKRVKDRPRNRPTAMGSKSLPESIRSDGHPSLRSGVNKRVLDASRARHGLLGWDRPDHETKLTVRHREMLLKNEELIKLVDRLYCASLPTAYTKQRRMLNKVPSHRVCGLNFSTVYIAKTFRTAYHTDTGNLPGVMTCLMPMGKYTGGELIFPRWRIAFHIQVW